MPSIEISLSNDPEFSHHHHHHHDENHLFPEKRNSRSRGAVLPLHDESALQPNMSLQEYLQNASSHHEYHDVIEIHDEDDDGINETDDEISILEKGSTRHAGGAKQGHATRSGGVFGGFKSMIQLKFASSMAPPVGTDEESRRIALTSLHVNFIEHR